VEQGLTEPSLSRPSAGEAGEGSGCGPPTAAEWDVVRGIGLFASLPPAALDRLRAGARVLAPPPLALLFEQEQPATALFVVLDGMVGTMAALGSHDRPGRREPCLVELVPAGEVVGEGGLFDTGLNPFSARTLTAARLVVLPAARILECLEAEPPFRRRMLAFLSVRLRVLVRQISQLKLMSASQRLGRFLLGLTERRRGPQTVHLACERRMIAGMLGMTPECLSRSLRQLQAHGVHSQGKRAILVEDRERLRAFAGAVG